MMSNEQVGEGESMYPSEAEVNAERPLTMSERIVKQIFGRSHTPCAGCRKR